MVFSVAAALGVTVTASGAAMAQTTTTPSTTTAPQPTETPDGQPIVPIPSPYNKELAPVVNTLPEIIYSGHEGDPQGATTQPNERAIKVYSPSMKRYVGIHVLLPPDRDKPAPILYMTNGAGGGEDAASWSVSTDFREWFSNKQTYVLTVIGGALTYYTDWIHEDKKFGIQKWDTFLSKELPQAVEGVPGKMEHFNGRRGILGISMAGTSIPALATVHPGFWNFVGSFSGCPQTADPWAANAMGIVTAPAVVGGNADNIENMWGPQGSEEWRRHDPVLNAQNVVGADTSYYIYSGLGLPGDHDVKGDPFMQGDADNKQLMNQMLTGGLIEVLAGVCTWNLKKKYAELGIPANIIISGKGTHSWGYWQDNLHWAWPQMQEALRTYELPESTMLPEKPRLSTKSQDAQQNGNAEGAQPGAQPQPVAPEPEQQYSGQQPGQTQGEPQ